MPKKNPKRTASLTLSPHEAPDDVDPLNEQRQFVSFMDDDAYLAWRSLPEWTEYEAMELFTETKMPPYFLFDIRAVNLETVLRKRVESAHDYPDFVSEPKVGDDALERLRRLVIQAKATGSLSLYPLSCGRDVTVMVASPDTWIEWAKSIDLDIPSAFLDCGRDSSMESASIPSVSSSSRPWLVWENVTLILDIESPSCAIQIRGFSDRRATPIALGLCTREGAPTRAWQWLSVFGTLRGFMPNEKLKPNERAAFKKQLAILNKALRRYFEDLGFEVNNPISHVRRPQSGYATKFKCSVRRR